MKKVLLLALSASLFASCGLFKESTKDTSHASDKEVNTHSDFPNKNAVANDMQIAKDYTHLPGGLKYRIIKDMPGTQYPNTGDYVELHLSTFIDDSLVFDTRSAMNDKPVPVQIQQVQMNPDLMSAIKKMTAGDSALVYISVDSLLAAGQPNPGWMKPNTEQFLEYRVQLVSVKTAEKVQEEKASAAAQQIAIDDKLIQDYLKQNNIQAIKTPSGLYYTIDRKGDGPKPVAGDKVFVNYTGRLLDGTTFDSNVDPQFNHVEPFTFSLGRSMVIKGWDEGVALLNEGSKATFFIPSGLAYGPDSPSPVIPANAVMVFDVELVDVQK